MFTVIGYVIPDAACRIRMLDGTRMLDRMLDAECNIRMLMHERIPKARQLISTRAARHGMCQLDIAVG